MNSHPLLDNINSPADLKKLSLEQLPQLCAEIRDYLIHVLSSNPGHFASSMGAVEIAVALHYVFDTPTDHIVWDVGHQAYPHKLLTGRRDAFAMIRKHGGLSGFPNPKESEYDTFVAGHAGNSISAALGMSVADQLTPGHENVLTVAVIGDASVSCGLAFEGLNNASQNNSNLLIILNDNDMSIDAGVGALHRYLSRINTSKKYNNARFRIFNWLKSKNIIGENGRRRLLRFNNSLKSLISKQQNIFEGLNIRYFGPTDGHNVVDLVAILREIKDMKGPRILHLHTIKGKGYESAEADPSTWHAPGKFNPETGERLKKMNEGEPLNWQDVFGNTIVELAAANDNIVGITAAMPSGTSIGKMMDAFPDRAFDVGISEGHAVTFAGGLAKCGKHPFVAIYSSFLQRAYDNIINDIAIDKLPVTFCIDRAGIVGEDGVTHHGMFDLAYLSLIPGMVVSSPMDVPSLRNLMYTSFLHNGPFAIRYPRGKSSNVFHKTEMHKLPLGKGRLISGDSTAKTAVLTLGPVGNDVQAILKKHPNMSVLHYDMIFLKPLDTEILQSVLSNTSKIITIEDGVRTGGLGTAVAQWMAEHKYMGQIVRMGAPDSWIGTGTVSELRTDAGYDAESIESELLKEC